MVKLPENVERCLTNPVFRRENPTDIFNSIELLDVQPGELFVEFFKRYAGPFGSKHSSFELLDVLLGEENIVKNTDACRKEFSFPKQYLVISGLLAGSVLVYDTKTEGVFNIDFEGGEKELISGVAKPEWHTFYDFLKSFFDE